MAVGTETADNPAFNGGGGDEEEVTQGEQGAAAPASDKPAEAMPMQPGGDDPGSGVARIFARLGQAPTNWCVG